MTRYIITADYPVTEEMPPTCGQPIGQLLADSPQEACLKLANELAQVPGFGPVEVDELFNQDPTVSASVRLASGVVIHASEYLVLRAPC